MKSILFNRFIVIGFCFVVAGVILPFLMVLKVVEPSLWLSFLSYAASLSGLFLGLLGAASIFKNR